MTLLRTLLAAATLAAGLTSAPALADKPRDAYKAFENKQRGRSMPLPQLERRVLPFMDGADYLGPELNGGVTRLKRSEEHRSELQSRQYLVCRLLLEK